MNLEFKVTITVDLDDIARGMTPPTKSAGAAIDRAIGNVIRHLAKLPEVISAQGSYSNEQSVERGKK